MPHYVLVEHHSGYVWGEADAENPVEACRKVDAEHSGEDYEYEIGFANNIKRGEGAYHVFLAPDDWVPVKDGQSQEELARVDQLPCVAVVITRRTPNDDDELFG